MVVPWNYPLATAGWKLGPALACGNTVVLKSSEFTPLSVLVLGQLIREAGFPPGVVNLISGYGADAGATLVSHPLVDKVSFTGSTNTGRQIMKMASATLKNITLETGGKSPLLVFSDADLEQAVKWSHLGIMSNQGQICTSTSRILVEESIYDEFVKEFVAEVKQVSKVGDQWDESTYQGPQVSKQQYEKILSYIKLGKEEGASVVTGGESLQQEKGKGFYIAPTVFTNVKDDMKICKSPSVLSATWTHPLTNTQIAKKYLALLSPSQAAKMKLTHFAKRTIRLMGWVRQSLRRTLSVPIEWLQISRLEWSGSTAARTLILASHSEESNSRALEESLERQAWRHTARSRLCISTWVTNCSVLGLQMSKSTRYILQICDRYKSIAGRRQSHQGSGWLG